MDFILLGCHNRDPDEDDANADTHTEARFKKFGCHNRDTDKFDADDANRLTLCAAADPLSAPPSRDKPDSLSNITVSTFLAPHSSHIKSFQHLRRVMCVF